MNSNRKNSKCIYLIITNPNHHWENTKQIISQGKVISTKIEVISFCELRRLSSPTQESKTLGIKLHRLIKLIPGIKASSGNNILGEVNSNKRRILYGFVFLFIIKPFLSKLISKNDIVIHYNDVAFPGYKIVPWLKNRGNKQILIQEGIRFPLPNATQDIIYGSKGVDILFCWGEEAKKHFEKVVLPNTKVVVSGSPRYEYLQSKITREYNDNNVIGFFTNPIDDLGFVTGHEKIAIFEMVIKKLTSCLVNAKIKLLLKTHPRENKEEYIDILNRYKVDFEIENNDIIDAINKVKGGIIFASSVGIELLFFGKKVAQVEIPHSGYVFDYVENKVALPINYQTEGEAVIKYLSDKDVSYNNYLNKHLFRENNPSQIILKHILGLNNGK